MKSWVVGTKACLADRALAMVFGPMPLLAMLWLAMLLPAMLLLGGCSDGDDPVRPGAAERVIMPLSVGHTWSYDTRLNMPGEPVVPVIKTIAGCVDIQYGGQTLSVAREVTANRGQASPAGSRSLVSAQGRLLRNESDGLYCYGIIEADGTDVVQTRYLVVPHAGVPGQDYFLNGTKVLSCVAADSLVDTSLGSLRVDVYEYLLDQGTIRVPDVYAIPGVGLTMYYAPESTAWLTGHDYIAPAGSAPTRATGETVRP